jgi:hypothetical protein
MQEIKKIEKVTPELLEDGRDFLSRASHILVIFNQRVEYIIKTILRSFDEKIGSAYWSFYIDDKENPLSLKNVFEKNMIDVRLSADFYYEEMSRSIIDKNDNLLLIRTCSTICFPMQWLYEDFEEELTLGKKAYDKLASEQDKANIKEQGKQNDLISSAKAKLLPEELEALSKEIFREKAV